jgi:TolA-binding protein
MGVEEAGPDRAFRDLEDTGYFRMGHSLDVKHGHNRSMIVGQLLHGLVQFLLKLSEVGFPDGVADGGGLEEVRVALDAGIHVVEAQGEAAPALFEEVDGHVDGDGMDPRVEAGFAAESPDRAEGFCEDILEEVVGVFVVGGHVVDKAVESGAVAQHQLVEGLGFPLLGAGDQFLVCGLGRFGHGRHPTPPRWSMARENAGGTRRFAGMVSRIPQMKPHPAIFAFVLAAASALFATSIVRAQSQAAQEANNAAYAKFSEGDHAAAAAAYEKLLKDYPTDAVVPSAQIQLAFSYYFLGKFQEALAMAQKVLSGPPLPDDLKQVVEGLVPQILSAEAAAMDPGDPKRKAAFDKAIAGFTDYIKKHPQAKDLENMVYSRAIANYQTGNFDEVIKDMESNIGQFGQSPTVASSRNLLALALATQGSQILNEGGNREEAFALYDRAADLLRQIINDRKDIALYNDANFQLAEILFNKAAFSDEEARQPIFAEALAAYRSIAPREEIIAMQQDRIAAFPERRLEAIKARNQDLLKQLERDNIRELTKLEELKNKPDQVASAVQKMGEIFFQQGNLNAARTLLRHVSPHLHTDEDKKRNLYFTALSYAMQGLNDPAMENYEAFQAAHKGDPIADNLPVAMGNMLLAQNKPAEAVKFFDESLEIYPEGRFAGLSVVSKASAEARLGQYDSAEQTFRDFLAKNPPPAVGVVAQAGLAGVLRDTAKWPGAIEEYTKLVAEFPGTPQAVEAGYWIGIATQQTGDNQTAAELLEAFSSEHPDHPLAPLALYARGTALIALNQKKEAMEVMAELAEKFPDSQPAPFTYFMRAQYSGAEGRPEEVIALMMAFIEKYPQDDKVFLAHETMAQTHINAGRREEALATYREFATTYAQSPEAATALQKSADLQRAAAEALGRYMALNDDERAMWKTNIEASVATAEEVIRAYPDSPQVAPTLRTLLQNQRLLVGAEMKTSEELETYFQSLADEAANPATKSKILFTLAGYVAESDAPRAMEIMQKAFDPAIVYSPQDLDAYGMALLDQNKLEDAAAVFDKLANDYPVPSGVAATAAPALVQQAQAMALFGKAGILQSQGQTTEAAKLFEQLKSLYPWSPKVLEADYGIALSLREKGSYDEALGALGAVIRAPTATAELRANSMLLFGDIMADQMKAAANPEEKSKFRDGAIDNYIKIAQFYGGVPTAAAKGLWLGARLIEEQAAASADPKFRTQQLNRAKLFYEQLAADYPNSEFAPKAKERAAALAK